MALITTLRSAEPFDSMMSNRSLALTLRASK